MPVDAQQTRTRPALQFRVPPGTDDWSLLLALHPNAFIVSPARAMGAVVDRLLPHLMKPVRFWSCGDGLWWPRGGNGALVLRDVDRLAAPDQMALVDRLDDCRGGIQLVAFSAAPLFPLVERGAFLDALYYRLNAVHLTIERQLPDAA